MEMNHYILSDLLLEVRRRFANENFTDKSASEYFRDSVAYIHDYFTNTEWKKDYLFSSIGFLDNNKAILTDYKFNSEELGGYHQSLMTNLSEWINESGSISITKMFLDERTVGEHYKALLHSGNALTVRLPQFIYIDLKTLGWQYAGELSAFESKFSQAYDFYKLFGRKLNGVVGNPFLQITHYKPSWEQKQQFDKLIAVFAEIASGLTGPVYFYFLKPVTFQNLYNVVLLLGLKRELTADEIEHWIDKTRTILSIIADKKLRLDEKSQAQIELLQSISAATHATQTTINTVFSAPLNSLKSAFPSDPRIKQLIQGKESLLLKGNLFNLLSKLGIKGDSDSAKEEVLRGSKFFSSESKPIDFKELLLSKLEIFNQDKSGSLKSIVPSFRGLKDIGKNFFQFKKLFATENFLEIIILTVIENCNEHAHSLNAKIYLDIFIDENEIIFTNQMKPMAEKLSTKPTSGNFLVINNILNQIDAGSIRFSTIKETFSAIIRTKQFQNG